MRRNSVMLTKMCTVNLSPSLPQDDLQAFTSMCALEKGK